MSDGHQIARRSACAPAAVERAKGLVPELGIGCRKHAAPSGETLTRAAGPAMAAKQGQQELVAPPGPREMRYIAL